MPSDDLLSRKPITGIVACCARAAIGHATAPPSNEMNSRRLIIRSPRRHAVAETKARRCLLPSRSSD